MAALWQSVRENLGFLAVVFAIFAALLCVAFLAERLSGAKRRLRSAKSVAFIGMFSAVAAVLMLIEIPLFFAPGFYKLDLSELSVLICTFYLGPVAGVLCELLKVILKLLLKGTTSAFVGEFANFVVGCSLVLPAGIVYACRKTKRGAVAALITGSLVLTVFGSLFNAWYLIPEFARLYGISVESIVAMGSAINSSISDLKTLVLFAVLPFNLLKGILVSVLTFLLYKRV